MYFDGPFGDRILPPNHLKSFPRRVLYLDTEARIIPRMDDALHVFRLAWSARVNYDSTGKPSAPRWILWKSARELCAYLGLQARPKEPLTVYAHNVLYDLQVGEVFKWLQEWGWKLEFIHDSGPVFLLTVSLEGARLRFVDTRNFFESSLRELGSSVGLAKGAIDFHHCTEEELATYCRQDVEILRSVMERYFAFNRAHDTGRFASTRSAQALSCYRHRFMDHPIHIHHAEEVIELERSSYFGGRNEAYRLGRISGGPFTAYDVNSMYPSVMRKRCYPTRLLRYYPEAVLQDLERFRGSAAIIAEVLLDTPLPLYAKRFAGKMMFPVGRFRTVLCTEGFWRAAAAGHIRELGSAAVYEWAPIFRSYVDYWYPIKRRYAKTGDELYGRIVKGFLNSLYGKFGQRQTELRSVAVPAFQGPYRLENTDLATGERWIEYRLLGSCWEQREVGNARYSFVAVAAHVAEYARFALWDLCARIGRERVLYCDTDSIILRASDGGAVDPELRGQRLGALDVAFHCQKLVLHGAKDYEADGVQVVKGIPASAKRTGKDQYSWEQFAGLAACLASGVTAGLITREVTHRLKRRYDKGRVREGGVVEPWVLEEP